MLGKASKNKQLTEACRQQVQSSGSKNKQLTEACRQQVQSSGSKNKQLTEACRQQVQSSGSLHWMSPRIVHLTSSVDTHSRLQCDSTFVINQHVHQHIPTASNITDNSNKKVNIYGKNIERAALNKHGFK